MKWTFGIITGGEDHYRLKKIYKSIHLQDIPKSKYEIIVVGGPKVETKKLKHISFEEDGKKWITKKKNLIAQNAKFDNLCMMHDYVFLYEGWYNEFKKFGGDWDVCMNAIITSQDFKPQQRFADWGCWPAFAEGECSYHLNYDDHSRIKEMYVSGTYFCVKKEYFLQNPLNEDLMHNEGEDVEWSDRLRNKWNYKMNKHSKCGLLKKKKNGAAWSTELGDEGESFLDNLKDSRFSDIYNI